VAGDTLVVTPSVAVGALEDWDVRLEYRGQAARSPTGEAIPAGQPYRFVYSRFDPKLQWDVKVFAWTESTHPVSSPDAFQALLRGERSAPVVTLRAPGRFPDRC
jgi:hypothetical protein